MNKPMTLEFSPEFICSAVNEMVYSGLYFVRMERETKIGFLAQMAWIDPYYMYYMGIEMYRS